MAKDPSKYDKLTGQRKIGYGTGAGAGALAGAGIGASLKKGPWKNRVGGAALGAGVGALYGLAKIKGRNDDNTKNKRFAAAGYLVGKRAERARLVRALEEARDKTKASPKKLDAPKDASEKTASDYMRAKQSKSKRYIVSTTKRKYVNKGFGGAKRRKKI